MQTDWLVVRRLAAEWERTLTGQRIRAAGTDARGRFVVQTGRASIALDPFAATPILTTADGSVALDRTLWWAAAMATALVGLRIERVRARRGDRLVAFDCAAQSRFGVASRYRLVAELVPRFGNLLLLKDDAIVTAAKEFPRGSGARATVVGEPYEPPPLPAAAGSVRLFATAATAGASAEDLANALRAEFPLLPRLAAQSFALEAQAMLLAGAATDAIATRTATQARALLEATEGAPQGLGDAFVYRRDGRIVAAYVMPLAQFAGDDLTRVAALVPAVDEAFAQSYRADIAQRAGSQRGAVAKRIAARLGAVASESAAVERERDDVASRDVLRRSGEVLYAYWFDIAPGATSFTSPDEPELVVALDPALDAKANAAAIFARYRKATARAARAAERLEFLERRREALEAFAWELERAQPGEVTGVADAFERFERGPKRGRTRPPQRLLPIEIPLGPDARAFVGRSPQGNADLTFRFARPDDLWFHARATPGAHVVLRIDSARAPEDGELERAAAAAAFHSKARDAGIVAVDYTERKHVRKRADGAPGQVWYVNARTVNVRPIAEA